MYDNIWQEYKPKNTYFLRSQFYDYNKRKPYKGLKILSNLHITKASICKLQPLLVSGAFVNVTATKYLNVEQDALDYLKNKGLYIPPEQAYNNEYDVILDCGSGFINHNKIRLGFVELTQSEIIYNHKTPSPIIDIDKSKIKIIENLYGTGNGLTRGLKQLKIPITNKNFVCFGFGKVGKGCVLELKKYSPNNIIIIESCADKIQTANNAGFQAVHIAHTNCLNTTISHAHCIITATGKKELISANFDNKIFSHIHKVNMGTFDEWGNKFTEKEILGNKKPLNFILDEPTEMQFLDPVFFAHNKSIEILMNTSNARGIIPFPEEEDNKIAQEWCTIHNFRCSLL